MRNDSPFKLSFVFDSQGEVTEGDTGGVEDCDQNCAVCIRECTRNWICSGPKWRNIYGAVVKEQSEGKKKGGSGDPGELLLQTALGVGLQQQLSTMPDACSPRATPEGPTATAAGPGLPSQPQRFLVTSP